MDEGHVAQDVRALARQFADEVRLQGPPRVDEVPRTRRTETVVLAILLPIALLVGGVEVAVLMRASTGGALPSPDPEVLRIESEPCMRRMASIGRAVEAYIEEHGTAPRTLGDLPAGALSEPAVEPRSGRPYEYKPDGNGYTLDCPNVGGHGV
ncbi:hypothetical protein L6Q96_00460 [Candidatus Binatia bacterium]|nr:hypothetical protein [Candidatus Binatia bacterium]